MNAFRRHLMPDISHGISMEDIDSWMEDGINDYAQYKQYRLDDSNGEEFNLVRKYGVNILDAYNKAQPVRHNISTKRQIKKCAIIAFNKNVTGIKWMTNYAIYYGDCRIFVDGKFYKSIKSTSEVITLPQGVSKYIILYADFNDGTAKNISCQITTAVSDADKTWYAFEEYPSLNSTCNNICDQYFSYKNNISQNFDGAWGIGKPHSLYRIPSNITKVTYRLLSGTDLTKGIRFGRNFNGFSHNDALYHTTLVGDIIYGGNCIDWLRMPTKFYPQINSNISGKLYFNDDISTIEEDITITSDVSTIIAGAFNRRPQFKRITFTDGYSSITHIGARAFNACTELEIEEGNHIFDNLQSVDSNSFSGVRTIKKAKVSRLIGDHAFSGSGLEEIELGNVVFSGYRFFPSSLRKMIFTSEEPINFPINSFYGQSNMCPEIWYKGSLENYLTKISGETKGLLSKYPSHLYLGQNEEELINVTIPSGITSIREMAFWNLENLKLVTFNGTETYIGSNAFASSGLNGVLELPDTELTIGSRAFAGTKITEIIFGIHRITFSSNAGNNLQFAFCNNIEKITLKYTGDFVMDGYIWYNVTSTPDVYYYGTIDEYTENVLIGLESRIKKLYVNVNQPIEGADLVIQAPSFKNVSWKFAFKNVNSITISGTSPSIPSETFSYNRDCIFIDLSSSITTIGNYAFRDVGVNINQFIIKLRWTGDSILQYSSNWGIKNTIGVELHVPIGEIQNYRDKGYTTTLYPNIINDL